MKTIGIIGLGFVGTAVLKGMSHAFEIRCFDKYKETYECSKRILPSEPEKIVSECDGPIFICVPTPMKKDGSCNTSIVEDVISNLDKKACKHNAKPIIIIKSTIPPGTTEKLNKEYNHIQCVFNPEFLRETTSVADFKNQDRIIIGGPHDAVNIVKNMYQIAYPHVAITKTSSTIAEMVKYVTNCFLATKVSFANEMAQICEKLGIDWDKVVEYASKDKRLGTSHWSVPGPDSNVGWGGKCFPKDLNAMIYAAKHLGIDPKVMEAVWMKNLEVRPEKDWEAIDGCLTS